MEDVYQDCQLNIWSDHSFAECRASQVHIPTTNNEVIEDHRNRALCVDSRKLDIGVIGVCPLQNFQSAKVVSHRLAEVQAVNAAATTLVTWCSIPAEIGDQWMDVHCWFASYFVIVPRVSMCFLGVVHALIFGVSYFVHCVSRSNCQNGSKWSSMSCPCHELFWIHDCHPRHLSALLAAIARLCRKLQPKQTMVTSMRKYPYLHEKHCKSSGSKTSQQDKTCVKMTWNIKKLQQNPKNLDEMKQS